MTTKQLTIKLSVEEMKALIKMANAQIRTPAEQARYLIRKSILDTGAFTVGETKPEDGWKEDKE